MKVTRNTSNIFVIKCIVLMLSLLMLHTIGSPSYLSFLFLQSSILTSHFLFIFSTNLKSIYILIMQQGICKFAWFVERKIFILVVFTNIIWANREGIFLIVFLFRSTEARKMMCFPKTHSILRCVLH